MIKKCTNRIWSRILARIKTKFPSTVPLRPGGLPQEIIDIITGYIHDEGSLRACTFASRSLRFATARRLHETLYIHFDPELGKMCTKPLRRTSTLHYLPFFTRVIISTRHDQPFRPGRFSRSDRRDFSRLENVQVLFITSLGLASFIPEIKTYFGRFSNALRPITLKGANGSGHELAPLTSSFPLLEDLDLDACWCSPRWSPENSPVPVYSSHPPLRGRFGFRFSSRAIASVLANLPGGLHFRHMEISGPSTQVLLNACRKSLETLELGTYDMKSEEPLRKICKLWLTIPQG